MRLERKEQYNLKYGICNEKLVIKSIILLYDIRRKKNRFQKLFFKWLGLYQICNAIKNKGIYTLEKLDRLQLFSTFIGNRIKKFYPCQQFKLNYTPNLNNKEILTLNNFLTDSNSKLSNLSDNF